MSCSRWGEPGVQHSPECDPEYVSPEARAVESDRTPATESEMWSIRFAELVAYSMIQNGVWIGC